MPRSPFLPLRFRVSAPIFGCLLLTLLLSLACVASAFAATGEKKWEFALGSPWSSVTPPGIAPDGTIYIGSNDNNLYAITPDGKKKWEFTTGSFISGSPAIAPNGTIYVGSKDDNLYAVSPNGKKEWEFAAGEDIDTSPAIAANGTIYVGSITPDKKLYAISPNGKKEWELELTSTYALGSLVISANGTIYGVTIDDNLRAVSPNGIQEWAFPLGDTPTGPPAIAANGTIYLGSWDKKLYAVSPNGKKEWEFLTGGKINTSPAIAANGTIYVGSDDHNLYAVSPNGREEWNYTTGDIIYSSPTIAADGTIYIGSHDYNLYAIGPDGQKKWKFTTGSYIFGFPTIAPDGTIYVGSDAKLYAIDGGDNGGLMQSAWPKANQNNQNTGREQARVSVVPGQAAAVAFRGRNATTMTSVQIAASYGLSSFTPAATVRASNATVAPAGATVAFRTAFTGTGSAVSGLRLYKLFDTNGTSTAAGDYAAAPDMTTDGTWWVTDANGNYLAANTVLDEGKEYYCDFVITDDGPYDEDATPGVILDPVVLGGFGSAGGDGDGGCVLRPDAASALGGLDWLLLLFAAPALWLLRRRWN